MFRYPEEQNLRNAMGFPNQGLLALLPRISEYQGLCPLGLNIGKNKDSTPKESIEELTILFETLLKHANYFVINVSSPNTAGLRALQEKSYLSELFSELNKNRNGKDLYLKIAPDLSQDKIIELTELATEYSLTGLIATNTTIVPDYGMGGMSGLILKEKSQKVRQLILNQKTNLELIAVGGLSGPPDLFQLWRDGGKVAQVYTAYVYQGPKLLQTFKKEMERFVGTQKLDLNSFFELPLDERKYRLKDF
jgi:dihydroorotate dehydrogenase